MLGDESFYDAKRGAAGWKPYFVGGETPPLSALVVDRARGWPALSPPLLAARAFRDALVRRGVTVAGRPGLGVAPAERGVARLGRLRPALARIVRHMNHESDNFYAEMLLKQLARRGRQGRHAPPAAASVVVATMREARASRSRAFASSTAPGSRASTA